MTNWWVSETQLYIVPTPIGNLGDITFRAVEVLKSVEVVLAEDTRKTGQLLKHFEISNKLQSFHQHNEHKVVDKLVQRMRSGESMALVSDAGTPGISDPGFLLVRAALQLECKIEVLPGATAFVPALIKSGFPTDRFIFEGFLPHKKGRQKRLLELANETRTVVLYESPHRLKKLLVQLLELMPERAVSVSRELTKLHEETVTGSLTEIIAAYEDREVKGELVVVINAQ